jgi:L-alanine-DL-glutamate epimerase-like enolase superfamily enzyme
MLDRDAIGIVMFDTGWVGGISEGHAIGKLAETYHRPVAPHDCTGPVTYIAGAHLCQALPNAMVQEGVRAYYAGGWYDDVVTDLPVVADGKVSAPSGAGLGTRLRPELLARRDVVSRVTS